MRVLHFQHVGVGVVLSNEMNKRPWMKSRVLATAKHPFGFEADYVIPPRVAHWLLAGYFWKHYDILHSHNHFPLPAYVLKKWKGRFVQHYHDPFGMQFYHAPCFTATPQMASRFTQAQWLPFPVDASLFHPRKHTHEKIRIGYSYNPTADPNKLRWIPHKELQAIKSDKIELAPLTKSVPYTLMPRYYQSLDIYVDRMGLGFYGWQAAEAAACGVAVLSQFSWRRESVPFLSVDRNNVSDIILELVDSPPRLHELKDNCEMYSWDTHEVGKTADQCIERYRSILIAHE